jgi:ech hydrogenase subunit A
MDIVLILILLPIAAALLVLFLPLERYAYIVTGAVLALLSGVVFALYTSLGTLIYQLSPLINSIIVIADVTLLLFFLYQGRLHNHPKVMMLAAAQLLLYGYIESIAPAAGSAEIMVDELSKFMFLIINGVGGIIVLYSVKYMEYEPTSPLKKRLFVGGLLVFLSVMNLIVIANSILLFFFLFEMTTLASYLLIAFRNDDLSRANALKALWMNQIGGMVILLGALIAILGFNTVMFDTLLQSSGGMVMFSVALLSMAALVKGASIPFEGWLLGAMVAPTPVSAMLHSATMVKIAPYLILKLAPVLVGSMVGGVISIIGALVFVTASYLALSRSVLKEIFGYSTVALLGLMIALAAIGTEESIKLALALMLFHALSKALLFLSAGVLERMYHAKDIEDMKGMVVRSPKTVGFILFGFVSLTLPPFGLFMGKLFAISSVASLLKEHPTNLIVLLSLIIGSALMVLLYFKVASALLSAPCDVEASTSIAIPDGFNVPLVLLSFFIVIGGLGYIMIQHNIFVVLLVFPMLLVFILPKFIRLMDRYDRSQPYHCGEKESFDSALVYYEPSLRVKKILYWGFGVLFVSVAIIGALS